MDEVEEGFFERRVEENLAYAFNQTGHAGVYAIGKLIEVVEMKSRFATEEERFFLKCVKDATEEVGGVPTQKTVFNRWYDPSLRTSHDTFRGIRDRLGFSWLPQGKRGKTGARDEELGRDSQRWCEGEPT